MHEWVKGQYNSVYFSLFLGTLHTRRQIKGKTIIWRLRVPKKAPFCIKSVAAVLYTDEPSSKIEKKILEAVASKNVFFNPRPGPETKHTFMKRAPKSETCSAQLTCWHGHLDQYSFVRLLEFTLGYLL
jgi:hypothetical protein